MKNYKIQYTEEVIREVVLSLPEPTREEVEYKLLAMSDPYPILESRTPRDVGRRLWTIDSVEEIQND